MTDIEAVISPQFIKYVNSNFSSNPKSGTKSGGNQTMEIYPKVPILGH